ncbi:MAG: hypothetical protein IJ038_00195 [Clostridia bacterium]|nr:hypothetical protein [Clostridia bacterium]
MFISYRDSSVRLTGRWDVTDERYAETTATGSYIEFAFEGKTAVACFDIEGNRFPFLHLWVQLDGGDMFECPIDAYLRVMAKAEGRHICRIIYKGGEEVYRRWYRPLHGKVSFKGVDTEKPVAIGEDNRKTIEFVGDSITEGVLIDVDYYCGGEPQYEADVINRIYQDDVCATYAWLTAERLDLRPIFMGYGAVGVTKAGMSNVPKAQKSYPFNFDGSPITHKSADVIVINHGANDRLKSAEEYIKGYGELLDVIRKMNPSSAVVSLSPFCGAFHEELGEFIKAYNADNGCDVKYVDSFEWISPTPLHPLRDGHKAVADRLVPILKDIIDG